jgi:hypothetical protein
VDTQTRFEEVFQELEEERQHVDESLRRLAVVAAYLRACCLGAVVHVASAALLDGLSNTQQQ